MIDTPPVVAFETINYYLTTQCATAADIDRFAGWLAGWQHVSA